MVLMIIPLLLLIMAAAGIFLMCIKRAYHLSRALILGSATVGAFICFIVAAVFLMSNRHQNFYLTVIAILLLLCLLLLAILLWGGIKKKHLTIPTCSLLAGCLVVALVFNLYQGYIDRIPSLAAESSDLLTQYAPYSTGSKVATLQEPPTLTLSGKFPILDGATALYPIYSAFAKTLYPQFVAEDTECSTTTLAYQKIVDGAADIIFVGGPSQAQQDYAKEQGVELVYTPIGREAFVFFVNANNPLENITVDQIRSIYSGQTTQWSQLGVSNLGKIKAFQRDEGSGSQSALVRLMGDSPLADPPKENVVAGMGGIISKTADYKNHRNAIGYSFRFYCTEMVQSNQIKLLNINGVAPTVENIENGTYPIASEFYAVTRSDADENTQLLLKWILGNQGQKLIEQTGYTPLY